MKTNNEVLKMINKIKQAMNNVLTDENGHLDGVVFFRVTVFLVVVVAPIAFKVEEVLIR